MSFHEVRLWDLATNALVWHFDYGGGNPGGVDAKFTPDARQVFASRGGEVHDAANGKLVRRLGLETSLAPSNFFRADRGRAWKQEAGMLTVFEVVSGKVLAEVALVREHEK
jgi:hypothetical protein